MYIDYIDLDNVVTDKLAINNSIKNIILTKRGSLPGKPEFGSDIFKIIFSPIDHISSNILERYIREPLAVYEPRIVVTKVTIKEIPEYNKVSIKIDCKYKNKGLLREENINISVQK